ncbi:MAG: glycosyltransferase family 4 protein [Sedimentisphaerales bacterium]|nr:glycosyltransferase family 4 protein [Sedimentisphaerales bacterium]
MKIVQITPSSGDSFYCENCLRDITLVRALRKLGHDVVMVPLYLPLPNNEGATTADTPLFFGGVNVYLQQKSAIFRKTPRWVDRLLDSPSLLRWLGRNASMTSPHDLGRMTLSMLRGEHGRQTKELERLLGWLESEADRVDVICLSNILLLGMARPIKERLDAAVVCQLQDEHGFLDALPSPYGRQAWELIVEHANDVDVFVAVSKYYGDFMRQRLGVGAAQMHVAHVGISLDGRELREKAPDVPTVGFLSQMCSVKGLDTLVEAFVSLKKKEQFKNARLRIAGGYSASDKAFLRHVHRMLKDSGLSGNVDFLTDFDEAAKIDFLNSLSVLCVPEKAPAACGMYVLESLAAGVPVVQPRSGVFVELLEMTGGGLLYEPDDDGEPARSIEALLLDPSYAAELGEKGRHAVYEEFDIEKTTARTVRIYEEIIG